ncbi:MAG: hydroxymethylbilane synthase [Firmicutes bacterium]|nr:hydroxymethylbilane synthase [Bacillota bacterium]
MRTLKLATRAGKLALVQANHVKDLLAEQGVEAEIIKVSTKGDQDRKSSLRAIGGDGLFVRGIEQVLLAGEADIAVHSSKDLPYELADGLVIAGVPKAAAAEDLLLIPRGRPLESVRVAGRTPVIGTGSARRRHYYAKLDPDVTFAEIRGNITTRVEKLRRGDYDAIILARAGLDRIHFDLSDFEVRHFTAAEMVPSCCQGILAVECREADTEIREVLAKISDEKTRQRFDIERRLFRGMQADCSVAAAVHAQIEEAGLSGDANPSGDAALTLYALLGEMESLRKGTCAEAESLIAAALKDLGL